MLLKPFDIVLLVLFALGAFCGGVWARTYFIPQFFPSLVIAAESRGMQMALRSAGQGGTYECRV